jgi:hypothetical protein
MQGGVLGIAFFSPAFVQQERQFWQLQQPEKKNRECEE